MANDIDNWVHLTFGVDPASFPPRIPRDHKGRHPAGQAASPNGDVDKLEHPKSDSGHSVGAPQPTGQPETQLGLADGQGANKEGVTEGIGVPDALDALKLLAGATGRTAAILVRNDSGDTLTLAGQQIPFGNFETPPPPKINANSKEDFSAKNTTVLGIATAGVEGTVKYKIGDNGPTLVLHFDNPLLKKNNADAKLEGQNPDGKYSTSAFAAPGNDAKFTFALEAKGGSQPGPGPGPGPQPGQDANASCQITITNNTKLALNLAHQGHDFGDFMNFPAQTVQPGGSTNCVSTHTPHAKDGQQGCKGFLVWEAQGAGGGAAVTWRVDWTNPIGGKNEAKATLDPQSAGFKSLEQIGQGDENVPVAFTLSGGGDGPGPQQGAATSCEISITNGTTLLLRLANQAHKQGNFTGPPANEVKPGGAITCADGGPQGCAGSLVYSIVQPADGAKPETVLGTWSMEWNNPPGESNEADAKLNPANTGLQSTATVGAGDSKVAVAFSLFGEAKPQPKPETEDPPFEPPAKPKQPTLRKGDKTPDGWVEYAQQLLIFHKAGNLQIDGDFGNTTLAAVIKFQRQNKLQVDGTIGDQTWAALREGAPEKPATDGRQPHSFEEKGKQARFTIEKPDDCRVSISNDNLRMNVVSVGEQPIEDNEVTVRVTQPDGTKKVQKGKIGPVTGKSPDGQGNIHTFTLDKFKQRFKIADPAKIGDCVIDAYLDKEIGGDVFSGKPAVDS